MSRIHRDVELLRFRKNRLLSFSATLKSNIECLKKHAFLSFSLEDQVHQLRRDCEELSKKIVSFRRSKLSDLIAIGNVCLNTSEGWIRIFNLKLLLFDQRDQILILEYLCHLLVLEFSYSCTTFLFPIGQSPKGHFLVDQYQLRHHFVDEPETASSLLDKNLEKALGPGPAANASNLNIIARIVYLLETLGAGSELESRYWKMASLIHEPLKNSDRFISSSGILTVPNTASDSLEREFNQL
jgi:hypothetical protein